MNPLFLLPLLAGLVVLIQMKKKLDRKLSIIIACCSIAIVAFATIAFLQSVSLFPDHQGEKIADLESKIALSQKIVVATT